MTDNLHTTIFFAVLSTTLAAAFVLTSPAASVTVIHAVVMCRSFQVIALMAVLVLFVDWLAGRGQA